MADYINARIAETAAYKSTLTDAQVLQDYNQSSSSLYQPASDAPFEIVFNGSAEKGAFSRNVAFGSLSSLSITANDKIKDMSGKKQKNAEVFENYYFSRETPSNNSLIHEFIQRATRKEVVNYLGNSGFENTTISNSWTATGTGASFVRSNTVAINGTYSGYLTGTSGLAINQEIDLDISLNDIMTLQFYAYSTTVKTLTLTINECYNATVNGTSTVAIAHSGKGWDQFSLSHTMVSSISNNLKIQIAISASGVYFDMAMLTYGRIKQFYTDNTNDGTSGIISYLQAKTGYYNTIGISTEDTSYIHPWALLKSSESPYEHAKQLADASNGRLFNINQSGVFEYKSFLTSDISLSAIDSIPSIAQVSAINQPLTANKVVVEGVRIEKKTTVDNVWRASDAIPDQSEETTVWAVYLNNGETWPDPTAYPDGLECVIVQ